MISKKSIITNTLSSVFVITIGIAPFSMASDHPVAIQFENKNLIIAEAHQHGQEKTSTHGSGGKHGEGQQGEGSQHRHGQDKDREGKGGHGKGGGDKHGEKKSDSMMQHGHDYAHMILSHADALKLTDEQLGKITRLHLKHKQEHQKLMQDMQKSMKTFKKECMKPGTSDDQLHKLGQDFKNALTKMIEFHIKERQAVHAILSDDQKNQLKTLKMDHDTHDDKQEDGHGGHKCC